MFVISHLRLASSTSFFRIEPTYIDGHCRSECFLSYHAGDYRLPSDVWNGVLYGIIIHKQLPCGIAWYGDCLVGAYIHLSVIDFCL